MMGDEDDKARPAIRRDGDSDVASSSSPFEGESVDWESELAAWDAALPIADEAPAGTSGRPSFSPPARTEDLPTPPPDVESVEFSPDEIVSSEIVIPALAADPAYMFPRTTVDEPLVPSEDEPLSSLDLLPEVEAEPEVRLDPRSIVVEPPTPRPEPSGLVLIPDVEQLAALTATATAPAPAGTPGLPFEAHEVGDPAAPQHAVFPEQTARTIIDDGLPELTGMFPRPPPEGPPAPGTSRPAAAPSPLFEDEPPAEEPVGLDLSFGHGPPSWSPEAFSVLPGLSDAQETTGPDHHVLREQLAFWTDELAAWREEGGPGGPPGEILLAAARAAEWAGQREVALQLYRETLEVDSGSLAALRGRARMVLTIPETEEQSIRAALEALAQFDGEEKAAYQSLLEEWEAWRGHSENRPDSPRPSTLEGALRKAERALRQVDRSGSAGALAVSGGELEGTVGAALMAQAARLREAEGDAAGAAALRTQVLTFSPGFPSAALGSLRWAARLPAEAALPELRSAVDILGPSPLSVAVLRWAAHLAQTLSQPEEVATLLWEAERVPGARLPIRDRLLLAPEVLADASAESVPREARVLAAEKQAARLHRAGSDREALEVLRAGAAGGPALPLALAAEALGRHVKDEGLQAEAWNLWAAGDPARRSFAHHHRAEALAARGTEGTDAVLAALRDAHEANLADPVFWQLAWKSLIARDREGAAQALAAGASAWEARGAPTLAATLAERAEELKLAGAPAEAVARALAREPAIDGDDPAGVVARMLDPGSSAEAIAELLQKSAPPGPSYGALEATGWLVQAGQGRAALSWFLERGPDTASPAMAFLLHRLIRLHAEPGNRAALLGALVPSGRTDLERATIELQRGEALEGIGDRAGAAAIYRQLLVGPLATDARVALHRVLWSMRDAEAVLGMLGERPGEGDSQEAARLIEEARIQADLLGDEALALSTLARARQRNPAMRDPRGALWIAAARSADFRSLVELLEEASAHELRSLRPALLDLAAQLDEGRSDGRTSVRLREAARREAVPPLSLGLLTHGLSSTLKDDPRAHAETHESLARTLEALPSPDDRAIAILLARAAELYQLASDDERALTLLREACTRDPTCLPALRGLRRLFLRHRAWDEAIRACEAEAAALHDPAHRAAAWTLAADIAEAKLGDGARAAALLRRILEDAPAHPVAFQRLRQSLGEQGQARALLDLLGTRLRGALDPAEVSSLRLERAVLLGGRLEDRAGAKDELRALLADQPQNLEGLWHLAGFELEDSAYAVASELYIRQARIERDPERLREIFLRIGDIYLRRLSDPKVATGAFERVLRLDPGNRDALAALSELYTRQGDFRRAVTVTAPLIEREPDPQKRLPFLLRLGGLWEKSGDGVRAAAAFKRAAEECPRSLQAVGELARFYERTKEPVARNVLLDRSLAILREDLRARPCDPMALRTAITLLRWRQRPACSTAAAHALIVLGDDSKEKSELESWASTPSDGRRLAPLVNPELEELSLPSYLPRGVRHVLRIVGPALAKASKANLKRWEVGRGDRIAPRSGPRAVIDALATDLGVREYELYISRSRPRALEVEPADPPVIVMGLELAAMGPAALRFAGGYALRLIPTWFDLLAQGTPAHGGALLAGIVRQFIADFKHPDLSEEEVAAATTRVSRVLGRALRVELAPFAAEIAVPLSLDRLRLAIQEAAARVGLLACGDLRVALQVLATLHGQPATTEGLAAVPVASALIDFVLSQEYEELVSALEAVS